MFYWTRGNESVSGLDTLRLAQYTVEDHYTSASEAIYETGSTFNSYSTSNIILSLSFHKCFGLLFRFSLLWQLLAMFIFEREGSPRLQNDTFGVLTL